jgi:large subunit ribosomal protein L4
MTSINSINIKGEAEEKVKLPDGVFGINTDPGLLAQAVRVFLSNQRKANARTKTRGEMSRTTAKMYRQKGTGRARHGSYSAPIFVGGGIAFGPTGEQNYKLHLSKKLIRRSLLGALSDKAREQKITVISDINKVSGKTKKAEKLVKNEKNLERCLLVIGEKEITAGRAFRNITGVTVIRPNQLNTYAVIACQKLVITPESLKEIVKLYAVN